MVRCWIWRPGLHHKIHLCPWSSCFITLCITLLMHPLNFSPFSFPVLAHREGPIIGGPYVQKNRIISCFLVWAKNCVWFLQFYAPLLPLPLDIPQKYSRKVIPGSWWSFPLARPWGHTRSSQVLGMRAPPEAPGEEKELQGALQLQPPSRLRMLWSHPTSDWPSHALWFLCFFPRATSPNRQVRQRNV